MAKTITVHEEKQRVVPKLSFGPKKARTIKQDVKELVITSDNSMVYLQGKFENQSFPELASSRGS